ncbi:MAG: adenine phosphoribosyltransferase [Thaumarchaeota archaeon]|nr:adenine phosphoribosyltransferase [Nitrososphaerota archaeon]
MRKGAGAREAGGVTPDLEADLKRAIRTIPDYPSKGVRFRDLTTLWKDGELSRRATEALADYCKEKVVDKIVGIEARGFIVGAPIADRMGVGFIPARKAGKLPHEKVGAEYELEYGKQGLEIHSDAIREGERVIIVDDLLATGGTSRAAKDLVEKLGGRVVGLAFVAELTFLGGRGKLAGYEVRSLARYDEKE